MRSPNADLGGLLQISSHNIMTRVFFFAHGTVAVSLKDNRRLALPAPLETATTATGD